MGLFELFVLAVGLSMDAFAVAVCKGLAMQKVSVKSYVIVGAWFGGFQGLMPLIGYFFGTKFHKYIASIDHWIAFILLAVIGANMIREAVKGGDEEHDGSLAFKTMLVLAIATSIDALASGISLALIDVHIVPAVLFIGVTTFILSAAGVKVGSVFGTKYKSKAEIAGGIILIVLGIKTLIEHLEIF